MFGLGKPEDERIANDRRYINGVRMGCSTALLNNPNILDENNYITKNINISNQNTSIHVCKGQAVNIFLNGEFIYGPIIGEADISIK